MEFFSPDELLKKKKKSLICNTATPSGWVFSMQDRPLLFVQYTLYLNRSVFSNGMRIHA